MVGAVGKNMAVYIWPTLSHVGSFNRIMAIQSEHP